MNSYSPWKQTLRTFIGLGIPSLSLSIPFLFPIQAQAQSSFSDVQGIWGQTCIESLVRRNIISGYPDGTFRPNAAVTRAEFAAMLSKAFPTAPINRSANQFSDVQSNFWAYSGIQNSSRTGFLSGYPGNYFRPNENIPRVQALVALASGLNYIPTSSVDVTLENFNDANVIPEYARSAIAAATERQLVVNYPNVRDLQPTQLASRVDIANFLCQATKTGTQAFVPTRYVALAPPQSPTPTPVPAPVRPSLSQAPANIAVGTQIPVRYLDAPLILLAPNETVEINLATTANINDSWGRVAIPRGSLIHGQIQPVQGGSRFVADGLRLKNDQQIPLSATSSVVGKALSLRDPNIINVLRNSAIGSTVAAAVNNLAGNQTIAVMKILPGTVPNYVNTNKGNNPTLTVSRNDLINAAITMGVSAITGGNYNPERLILGPGSTDNSNLNGIVKPVSDDVVAIDAQRDLTLTLHSGLLVRED
ncbi:S-layer homology domain-containing protein [Thermosynechococcaceae cyanobacterium BACA0444]|uniref:S-layer homology domain-containing protein n=1 Tax=Pseudocalidococcus azoricus BACA0444 TaxID=2918990 RepID=A0AAE4FTB4_9CYAN|nr:S-layer homology domain-containing protein [Pseudocalidococcus azoricus]MDS3861933.1 S-layer homology domain-containing protein [Pseudocalidococcus azoricus BACA0444]